MAALAQQDGVTVLSVSDTQIHLQIQIASAQVRVLSTPTGETVRIEHFGLDGQPGEYFLPTRGVMLALPPESQPQVNFQLGDWRFIASENAAVVPNFDPASNNWKVSEIPPRAAQSPAVSIAQVGWIRDQYVAIVRVQPAQYDAGRKAFRVAHRIDITISFRQPDAASAGFSRRAPRPAAADSSLWRSLVNPRQAQKWRAKASSRRGARAGKSARVLQTENRARLVVERAAWYRVSGRELADAGVDYLGRDPAGIRLSYRDMEIPIMITGDRDGSFDETDEILFYGEINHGAKTYLSQFIEENVYVVSYRQNPGARFAEMDGGLYQNGLNSPQTFTARMHFETDFYFDRLLLLPDILADHWFWQLLKAGEQKEVPFTIAAPLANAAPGRMAVAFMGSTHPNTANPDHSVVVLLNGEPIGTGRWDGQSAYVLEGLPVRPGLLRDGENILTVKAPGDTDAGEVDQFYLNWFDLEYERAFQAVQDQLEFWPPADLVGGVAQFKVTGLQRQEVLVLGGEAGRYDRFFANYLLQRQDDGSYSLEFQDPLATAGSRYSVLPVDKMAPVLRIEVDQPSDLRATGRGADYILIAAPEFLQGIQSLADFRRQQGMKVEIVNVQDIYDEFGGGNFGVEPVREFLRFAYENWQPRPEYVLLVGDAHYGNRKKASENWPSKTFIPTYLAYTFSWGATVSDNYFVEVAGEDVLPDLAIGRLPANNDAELQAMVDKIIAYEKNPDYGRWRAEINLSAGDGRFFEYQSNYLDDNIISKDVKVSRIYVNPKSAYFGSTEELVGFFDSGAVLMNFVGHGGGGVFFDSELFLLEDIARLANRGRWPVILAWSCFIGYFDNPFTPSLGEALFRTPGVGSIGTFGSSGRAWVGGGFFFNVAFYEAIFNDGERRLGEIARKSKIGLVRKTGGYFDMVQNYNLVGDPAMRLPLPKKKMQVSVDNPRLESGETVQVRGQVPGASVGNVVVEAYVKDDSLVSSSTVPLTGGSFQAALPIANSLSGEGVIRTYFWGSNSEATGFSTYSIDQPYFADIVLKPAQPLHQDSVFISTRPLIGNGERIDSLFVEWGVRTTLMSTVVPMQPAPGQTGVFETIEPIRVVGGNTVYYRFRMHKSGAGGQDTVYSGVRKFQVKRLPDLTFVAYRASMGGKDRAVFRFRVQNTGDLPASAFRAGLFSGYQPGTPANSTALLAATQAQGIAPHDTQQVEIIWNAPVPGKQDFTLRLDMNDAVTEASEGNNLQYLRQMLLATVAGGTGGFLYSADSSAAVRIAANALAENRFLQLQARRDTETLQKQLPGGVLPVLLKNRRGPFMHVGAGEETLQFRSGGAVQVRLFVDPADANYRSAIQDNSLRAYFWNDADAQFSVLNHTLDKQGGMVQVSLPAAGAVAVARLTDAQEPEILVKFADQLFQDQDFVGANPRISIVVADPAGIDLQKLVIMLDEQAPSSADFSLARTDPQGSKVIAALTPSLSTGTHRLQVTAFDRNGNRANTELAFRVAENFELVALANHPNPFQNETIIAYTLPVEAQEVALKIYTVAGQLIRDWQFFNEVGYIEHTWDGRDQYGEPVPNGVYYLRFQARQGDQVIERTEKVARLR